MRFLLAAVFLFVFMSSGAAARSLTGVTVDEVNLVFERKGAAVEVEQFVSLSESELKNAKQGVYRIELPKGASGLAPIGDEHSGIAFDGKSVSVKGPIEKDGTEVSFRYYLPIEDEAVIFDQKLNSGIKNVRAVSTWTIRGAGLVGKGFGQTRTVELSSGIEALVASSRELPDGRIALTLTNLSDGPEAARRLFSLVLCIALMVLGLVFQIRRKTISRGKKAQKQQAEAS